MSNEAKWFGWKLAGLVGAAFLLVSVTAAAAINPPSPAIAPVFDYLGITGVLALVGWAIQWGQHKEFKKSTLARLDAMDEGLLRTDRWEDQRDALQRQHTEVLERIENLHRSLQTIRRDQLERIHGLTDKDGGV